MNNIICEAIKNKKKIQFYYDGGERVAEPYCYGVNKKGNELLCAFQTEGYSESGNPIDWKLYNTLKMTNIEITDYSFPGNRQGYKPNDSRMVRIYCNI